jgi:UDP-N-acetylmuramate dehydrogenase
MPLSQAQKDALFDALSGEGELRFDEPMARHTTLRIGGPADAWIAPSRIEAALRLRRACRALGLPCRALGAGSNLLVQDGGVRGVLLASERLRGLRFDEAPGEDGRTAVYVEAGVSTGKLLVEATKRSLGGVEFLGGVPGSVGGGLAMNAGTYLGEFKDVTVRVDSIDEEGALIGRDAAACGFVYRGSAFPPTDMIVAGTLRLPPRPRSEIEEVVRSLRDRRRQREPHGFPNAGSIFKNPPGDFAGRLIEACGLKGTRIGDAEVAVAHANWILNMDRARAADVLALIERVRRDVQERFGVRLELEVKVIGEAA